MRTLLLTLVVAAVGLVAAAPAHAGPPIKSLPACADSYRYYADGVSREPFRAALLCLINAARRAQGLPALTRHATLETVAQAQSDVFARTGRASHGKSVTDIGKRFVRRGYRPAAYNEAFDLVHSLPGVSPYAFLASMTSARQVPCRQLFDPRVKDVGIGVSVAPFGTTLAIEYGLKAGQKQPSRNTRPGATCPHRVPAPVITGPAITPRGLPTASDTAVFAELGCLAQATCTVSAAMTLKGSGATSPAQSLTIPAGATQTVTFPFDAAALAAERAGSQPRVVLNLTVTAPAQYTTELTGPLSVPRE